MNANDPELASFVLTSLPGVKRDGTNLDNAHYQNAQWVRFQRGRPRKMGGYQLLSDLIAGPVRTMYVDARSISNTAHSFAPTGVDRLNFDQNGVAGGVVVRTPTTFAPNSNYTWQADAMFDSGGAGAPLLIAAAMPDADNIASDDAGSVYYGDITASAPLVEVEDGTGPILVSGGCCVLQPFLFLYGSNGLIKNSGPNDISVATGWSGALANEANVAGSKIVKGLPTRGGGRAPSGLFWALDSLIRVSFINDGTTVWQYDIVSSATSILAKNGVVEHDNVYYWPGVDRFYMYNGVVQELPNDMNLNFFYDEINMAHRNKVWALKVPRFGEIWWFFPRGDATECNHAVIYNVRERTWYDVALERTAGVSAQIYPKPLLAGGNAIETYRVVFTGLVGGFVIGETMTGGTSGATGIVRRPFTDAVNVEMLAGVFLDTETITTSSGSATVDGAPTIEELNAIWQHETGTNRVFKQEVQAIRATVETTQFQWMTGGPVSEALQGASVQTRLMRIEPDFVLSGTLNLYINGAAYAQGPKTLSGAFPITATTEFVSMREQRREISVVIESNELGGDFQMGRNFISAEPGDARG